MWIGFVASVVALLSLLAAAGASHEEPASAPVEIDSLPGRVVDVKAGEFYFRAPDTVPAGLTTFRLEPNNYALVCHTGSAGKTGAGRICSTG